MSKRVQDITPGSRRSIRDIPVEHRAAMTATMPNKRIRTAVREEEEEEVREAKERDKPVQIRRMPMTPPPRAKKKKRRGFGLLISLLIIVLIAGVAYGASIYMAHASFTLIPKTIPVAVNGVYVGKNPASGTAVSYELTPFSRTVSEIVPASEGASVSVKAQGKMILYNTYSIQSQSLVAGTRVANETGKIYRLASSAVIPGYTRSSAGTITPGNITVTVVADQAGDTYNVSRTASGGDYKIVAYQGTARAGGFYGRLSTDIAGGFIGKRKTVSPAVLSSTTATLQSRLRADLIAEAQKNVPEGRVFYDTGYILVFGTPVVGGTEPNTAAISAEGTLYAITFDRQELAAALGGETAISSFRSLPYSTVGMDELSFTLNNEKDFAPNRGLANTLIFKLEGNFKLSGEIPTEELKAKLAGISLSESTDVLREYSPVIAEGSRGELIPPWASRIPADTSKISITIDE
jgi:hypothetical protein